MLFTQVKTANFIIQDCSIRSKVIHDFPKHRQTHKQIPLNHIWVRAKKNYAPFFLPYHVSFWKKIATHKIFVVNVRDAVLDEGQRRKFENSKLFLSPFFADLDKEDFGFVQDVVDF